MTGTELIQKAKTQFPVRFAARFNWWTRSAKGLRIHSYNPRICALAAAGDVLPEEARAMTYEEAKA
jgi:hypothetical protein